MGKKSKRTRVGGGGGDVSTSPPPSKLTPGARESKSIIEEETAENLRFEDPFEDTYEEEKLIDDDRCGDDGEGDDDDDAPMSR